MRTSARMAIVALVVAVAAGTGAASASADIWTPVETGTTHSISAVDYTASHLIFATTSGEIFKRQPDGSFAQKQVSTGIQINDLDFQPGGGVGLAVGNAGVVYRTTNDGDSWSALAIPSNVATKDCSATHTGGRCAICPG